MIHFRLWGLTLVSLSTSMVLASCNVNNQQSAQTAPPDHRAADESLIRSADADWVKAMSQKDVQSWASYYVEGSSLFTPGAPIATGKDAIQKALAGMVGSPGFALTFSPAKIEVSRAGDLAYEIGDYQLTTNDKKGKPQTIKAKYITVWGKQADGNWKALVDAPTTTQ